MAVVVLSFLLAVVTPIKATWGTEGFILTCGVRVCHGRTVMAGGTGGSCLHCMQSGSTGDVGAQPTSWVLFSLGFQLPEGWVLHAQLNLSKKTVLAMPRHPRV